MNKIHSYKNTAYHPRWLSDLFGLAVKNHPVVILTGARQVGKSTFLHKTASTKNWFHLTFDDSDVLAQAKRDPKELWAGQKNIILDEVQREPSVLLSIKKTVDENPHIRFVLSGSANLLLMKHVSESLAGRAVYFEMAPLTWGEIKNNAPNNLLGQALKKVFPRLHEKVALQPSVEDLAVKGFMPGLLKYRDLSSCVQWWEGYVSTYVERDLRQFSLIDSLMDFRRCMAVLSLRNGQVLNQSEVARDVGVSQPTFHRYLNLMEASCLIHLLPSFSRNRTSRLVKAPKIYFFDPALALFLSGIHDPHSLKNNAASGPAFESIVHHHLRVMCSLMIPRARLHYWRTRDGKEVDFIVEHGQNLVALEVKRSLRPSHGDAQGLREFINLHPETKSALVVHAGKDTYPLGEKITAVPWTCL